MGNDEVLRVFSQLGADLNAADLNGTSPLLAAVQEGHIDTVRLLCECGAEIVCADTDGFTPVYLAAQLGNDEMVRVLYSLGADLEAPDNDGMTPVLTAAQENRVTVVRTLHALGANINTPDNVEAVSPLHIAAETGHAEMVSVLIELGASVATVARDGNQPLWIAAHEGHLGCVRALSAVPGLPRRASAERKRHFARAGRGSKRSPRGAGFPPPSGKCRLPRRRTDGCSGERG